MEINKPDQGVLKGMGRLEVEKHINRKYFPKIRNVEQFEFSHHHPNTYKSTFQRFHSAPKPPPGTFTSKSKGQNNTSSIQLAHDSQHYFNPLSATTYQPHQSVPPKPIRQK